MEVVALIMLQSRSGGMPRRMLYFMNGTGTRLVPPDWYLPVHGCYGEMREKSILLIKSGREHLLRDQGEIPMA